MTTSALYDYAEFRINKLMEAKAQYEQNIQVLMNDIAIIDEEIQLLEKVKQENWA